MLYGDGWTFDPVSQNFVSEHGQRIDKDDLRSIVIAFLAGVEMDLRNLATGDKRDDGAKPIPFTSRG